MMISNELARSTVPLARRAHAEDGGAAAGPRRHSSRGAWSLDVDPRERVEAERSHELCRRCDRLPPRWRAAGTASPLADGRWPASFVACSRLAGSCSSRARRQRADARYLARQLRRVFATSSRRKCAVARLRKLLPVPQLRHLPLGGGHVLGLETASEFGAPAVDQMQWLRLRWSQRGARRPSTRGAQRRLLQPPRLSAARRPTMTSARRVAARRSRRAVAAALRDVGLVREQASAVRTEVLALAARCRRRGELGGVGGAAARGAARAPVEMERSAGEMLVQAERVDARSSRRRRRRTRGTHHAAAAGGVGVLSAGIAALSDGARALFPDAEARAAAVRGGLLERLRPLLLDAVASHAADATAQHVGVYRELGRESDARAAYAECRQGHSSRRGTRATAASRAARSSPPSSPPSRRRAAAELAFLGRAWPSLGRGRPPPSPPTSSPARSRPTRRARGGGGRPLERATPPRSATRAPITARQAARCPCVCARGGRLRRRRAGGARTRARGARRSEWSRAPRPRRQQPTLLWPSLDPQLAPLLPPPPAADADAGDALEGRRRRRSARRRR